MQLDGHRNRDPRNMREGVGGKEQTNFASCHLEVMNLKVMSCKVRSARNVFFKSF